MVCTRDVNSPWVARNWVAQQLAGRVDASVIDAFRLIVSELITNAILHGVGTIELCVAARGGRARVEVTDESSDCDVVIPIAPDETGRGLRIVDANADRWGCRHTDHGKTVWAELDVRDCLDARRAD